MTKNPEKAFELLDRLPKYDVKPGLERIEFLLEKLGNPDKNFRAIHIAGSNGKGSVAAMLFGVLSQNHRVGEFLSPPLRGFSDRILVDSTRIDRTSLVEGASRLEKPIRELRQKGNEPSFFEAATALAAWYFSREEVDLALLEAGLGGRYDATNPLGQHLLSVITSVDLEHQNILGESIEEIARELAGIAKPNRPLIIGPIEDRHEAVFDQECLEKDCSPIYSGEETAVSLGDFSWNGSLFEVNRSNIPELEGKTLELGLAGTYQEKNLTTALTVLGSLKDPEFSSDPEGIRTGLKRARWPGRFQLLEKNPHLIVDGAHNEPAARLLADELRQYLPLRPEGAKTRLVFSGLKDKDIKGMLSALKPVVDEVYLTELDLPRAAPLKGLEKWADQIGLGYRGIHSPKKAIKIAKEGAKPEDLICITGSLYLVREAMGNEFRREVE